MSGTNRPMTNTCILRQRKTPGKRNSKRKLHPYTLCPGMSNASN